LTPSASGADTRGSATDDGTPEIEPLTDRSTDPLADALRGVVEAPSPCIQCEAESVARCGRCDEPLCATHAPVDGKRCVECEAEWAALPSLRSGENLAIIVGGSIGAVLGIGLLRAHVLPGLGKLGVYVALFGPAIVLMALSLAIAWTVRRRRLRARRHRFLTVPYRRDRQHRVATVSLSALRAVAPWFYGIAIAWAIAGFALAGMLISHGHETDWIPLSLAIPAPVAIAAAVVLWALRLAPSRRRVFQFIDDRVVICDGAERLLWTAPTAEVQPELVGVSDPLDGAADPWIRPALRFGGARLAPFTVYCDRTARLSSKTEVPRVRSPTYRIDKATWEHLVEELGFHVPSAYD